MPEFNDESNKNAQNKLFYTEKRNLLWFYDLSL